MNLYGITVMNDVAMMPLPTLLGLIEAASENGAKKGIEATLEHQKEDPNELLAVVDIAKQYGYHKNTLFAKINKRSIETFEYPKNRKQLAIMRKDLNELLKK